MNQTLLRRILPLLLAAALAVPLLSACSAKAFLGIREADTSSFEGAFMEKVTGENESGVVEDMNLDHVTSLRFSQSALHDYSYEITDRDTIRELMNRFAGITFTRLNGQDTDWEHEDELMRIILPLTADSLVIHYTVDFRETSGAFYVSGKGQVCWFTSDEQAVLVSEEGAVSYTELIAWFNEVD